MTPVLSPSQAMQYMELIPKEMQPVAGTDGACYRRRQLMRQLPLYDQDPAQCRGLADGELQLMEDFVKKYKAEALGVGEVALPGQAGGKEEAKAQDKSVTADKPPEATNGALERPPAGGHYVSAALRGGGLAGCPALLRAPGAAGGRSPSQAETGKVAAVRAVCAPCSQHCSCGLQCCRVPPCHDVLW